MNKKYNSNESFFKTITHDSAYVLGWIASDGCVQYIPNKSYKIRLELKDKDVLEDIKRLIDTDTEIYTTSRHTGRIGLTGKSDVLSELYLLQISSKKMVKNLLDLGIHPNKTKRNKVPKEITDEFMKDFILGYFDSDGSIYVEERGKYKRLKTYICSCTREILEQFGAFLKSEIGIIPKIYQENPKGYAPLYKLMYSSKESYALCRYLYKDAKTFLKRKHDVYINSVENKVGICVKKCKRCGVELVDVNGNCKYCHKCKKEVLKERDKTKNQRRKLQRQKKKQQEIVSN